MQMHNSISVALNWSSRPSKIEKTVVELLFTHSSTRSVFRCGLTNMPHLKYVNRSPRSRQWSTRGVQETKLETVSRPQLTSCRLYTTLTQKRKMPNSRAVVWYVYSHTYYSFRVKFIKEKKKEDKQNRNFHVWFSRMQSRLAELIWQIQQQNSQGIQFINILQSFVLFFMELLLYLMYRRPL